MQKDQLTDAVEVTIVGAGVMGLLSAFELADAGASVRVLDRGTAAMESSWAGGGIVSPLYPWRYPTSVTALASWSQRAYPNFLEVLNERTGIDPEWRCHGMLVTAMGERAAAVQWGRGLEQAVFEVSAIEAHALEPHVALDEPPLWMPKIASVRTPRLGQALRALCRQHPRIALLERAEVTLAGSIAAPEVWVSGQQLKSQRVVVAAGAWTANLLAPLGLFCPIQPMKGQMLLFAPNHLVSRVVLADGRYAIPRACGRLVFGSTLEDVGFQRTPDREAHDSLYASALALIPELQSVPLEAQWAGFRPGMPDGIPWIGPYSDRLWINAGHFRNGVVLAPASARLLADLLLERPPIVDPAPYQPKRQH